MIGRILAHLEQTYRRGAVLGANQQPGNALFSQDGTLRKVADLNDHSQYLEICAVPSFREISQAYHRNCWRRVAPAQLRKNQRKNWPLTMVWYLDWIRRTVAYVES